MGSWESFLRNVPPARAAVGAIVILLAASFSLGAASISWVGLPERQDQQGEQIQALSLKLDRHITQDSMATARIYCVVKLLFEGGEVDPLDCDPLVRDRDQ